MDTSRLDTEPTLLCPACYEKNTPLQEGRVYLITDPDFQPTFHHPKNILFLMIGKTYRNYELTQPNMCVIPEDFPANTIFNKLQEIFILYDLSVSITARIVFSGTSKKRSLSAMCSR